MATPPSSGTSHDDLAGEIDRLLKQLPAADVRPKRGDPAPPRPRSAPLVPLAGKSRRPGRSAHQRQANVWLRALTALGLGAAVPYWPYLRDCGPQLYLYLGVVAVLMVAGGWVAVSAWKARNAAAHVLSLVIVYWGIVVAAEQVLPRVGYATVSAEWDCRP